MNSKYTSVYRSRTYKPTGFILNKDLFDRGSKALWMGFGERIPKTKMRFQKHPDGFGRSPKKPLFTALKIKLS